MDTDNQKVFTPEEYAQCAAEALENWDWDIELENYSSEEVEAMKEALRFDADYARKGFSDDDGLIRISPTLGNVWNNLDEFAHSTASSYMANKQHYGW
jgi:hypothetical protein